MPQRPHELFEPIVGHSKVSTRGHISPNQTGRLFQGHRLGVFETLPRFNAPQPISQNRASVRVATGLQQGFEQRLWPLTQYDIAARLVANSRARERRPR